MILNYKYGVVQNLSGKVMFCIVNVRFLNKEIYGEWSDPAMTHQ